MPIHSVNMGSSPMSSSSTETGSVIRGTATSTSGGFNTQQPNVTSAGNSGRTREPIITSINDNADIETSAALLEGDDADLFATPGSNYSDAQSVVATPIRRIGSVIHSEPIDIPARGGNGNGNGHAATSPAARGTARDEITPGRPPSTGPRCVGPDPALLATPAGGRRRVVSPTFRRLMSPSNYMIGRGTATRPSVTSSPAAPVVVTADTGTQTNGGVGGDEEEQIFVMDGVPDSRRDRDRSSVLSGGVGDRVLQITSPTDGVPLPVSFPPETTTAPRSSRARRSGTVVGPRGPRNMMGTGTATVRRVRNARDTNLLSSSVASLMPRSSSSSSSSSSGESSRDRSHLDRTVRVRGPGLVSCGPRAHVAPITVLDSSSSSLSTQVSGDLERQPLLPPSSRRRRSYGSVPVRDNEGDGAGQDQGQQREGGFWNRFTRSEAVLFAMFLCSVMFGFSFMTLVMVHLMRSS